MRTTQKLAVVAATPLLVASPVSARTTSGQSGAAYASGAEFVLRERLIAEILSTDLSTKLDLAQDRLPTLQLAQAQACPSATSAQCVAGAQSGRRAQIRTTRETAATCAPAGANNGVPAVQAGAGNNLNTSMVASGGRAGHAQNPSGGNVANPSMVASGGCAAAPTPTGGCAPRGVAPNAAVAGDVPTQTCGCAAPH